LPGSMTRVAVLLMVVVVAHMVFPQADLFWVTIGVGVAYGVPFAVRLWRLVSEKRGGGKTG